MARAAMCTTVSASIGGLTVVFFDRIFSKTYDVGMVCNGILAGLVSITAGCSVTLQWSAFVIGIFGGMIYFAASKTVLNICKVDDPLDAYAVHGACGMWGTFAVGLFAADAYAARPAPTSHHRDESPLPSRAENTRRATPKSAHPARRDHPKTR